MDLWGPRRQCLTTSVCPQLPDPGQGALSTDAEVPAPAADRGDEKTVAKQLRQQIENGEINIEWLKAEVTADEGCR